MMLVLTYEYEYTIHDIVYSSYYYAIIYFFTGFSLLPPPAVTIVFKETAVNWRPMTCGLFNMTLNWTHPTGIINILQYCYMYWGYMYEAIYSLVEQSDCRLC